MKVNTPELLKEKLIKENKFGLALDIDDTLSLAAEYTITRIHLDLEMPTEKSPKELIEQYGDKYEGEFWQRAEVMDWFENISDDFIESHPLIENVQESITKINKIIPIQAYITARRGNYYNPTLNWLKKHKFPEAPLICRPLDDTCDWSSVWKARVLEGLYPNIIGIVDDNPFLAGELANDYKGVHFLYGFDKNNRKDIDVVACPDWKCVYEEVKKRYSVGKIVFDNYIKD